MKDLTGIRSFRLGVLSKAPMLNSDIRKDDGCKVDSFLDLTWKVAELQYANPEYMLLFRDRSATI